MNIKCAHDLVIPYVILSDLPSHIPTDIGKVIFFSVSSLILNMQYVLNTYSFSFLIWQRYMYEQDSHVSCAGVYNILARYSAERKIIIFPVCFYQSIRLQDNLKLHCVYKFSKIWIRQIS